ncbi:oxidative stress-induced growth inhibitor 1-like isoform X1 [Artemia franciscana]
MVVQKRFQRRRSYSSSLTSYETVDSPRIRANSTSDQVKPEIKPVVVIGNGPSAITLSFMLSGWRPYYNGSLQRNHPNEFLHARLMENPGMSLVDQNLEFLSEGLIGRSKNPVSLLFDSLQHPNADFGEDTPSFLSWKYHPEVAIDHVVLGKGPPGGSWQAMDGHILTISLGSWMELPDLPLRDSMKSGDSRASVSTVANYYSNYVERKGLRKYFKNGNFVTSVRKVSRPEATNVRCLACEEPYFFGREIHLCELLTNNQIWEVHGFSEQTKKSFCYLTPNVVLAVGGNDIPNSLRVSGENSPFVLKSLNTFEQLLDSGELNDKSDPVLIVGAGLSAADAVIAARHYSIPVIHSFRRGVADPALIFRQLPPTMYPEYHKVYQMMVDGGENYPGYRSLPQHEVVKILPEKTVLVQGPLSSGKIKVSYVILLIGSRPNLNFMPKSGLGLGFIPDAYVTTMGNSVAVDCFSMECVTQQGLYAMGPLIGDNFVRFAQGSALSIAQSISRRISKV